LEELVAKAFALILILLSVSLGAFADEVSLKNGDRLSGTIVKSDGKTLVLHTDYAGDLSIKWDVVQGIESKETLHVQLQDGKTLAGPVTTSDSKLVISGSSGQREVPLTDVTTVRGTAEQVAYEKSLHPGIFQEWSSGLNLGFALTRGNSQSKNLSVGFLATRQTLHDKLGAYVNSVYAANDAPGAVPSTTANAAGGGFRYDHDISSRTFGFAAADFFADALQGLNLRSVIGGGAGYHAIKTDTTALDFLGGLNYTHESYTVFTRNFAALTIGEDLTHKIGKGTVLNQQLTFFPNLNNTGEYRATFDFGSVTKLSKWLGWQNSLSDIYVTNPPLGKRQNDLILTTGLNVSWGK
jgi:putative salt-induced outer membrane protein YdiY